VAAWLRQAMGGITVRRLVIIGILMAACIAEEQHDSPIQESASQDEAKIVPEQESSSPLAVEQHSDAYKRHAMRARLDSVARKAGSAAADMVIKRGGDASEANTAAQQAAEAAAWGTFQKIAAARARTAAIAASKLALKNDEDGTSAAVAAAKDSVQTTYELAVSRRQRAKDTAAELARKYSVSQTQKLHVDIHWENRAKRHIKSKVAKLAKVEVERIEKQRLAAKVAATKKKLAVQRFRENLKELCDKRVRKKVAEVLQERSTKSSEVTDKKEGEDRHKERAKKEAARIVLEDVASWKEKAFKRWNAKKGVLKKQIQAQQADQLKAETARSTMERLQLANSETVDSIYAAIQKAKIVAQKANKKIRKKHDALQASVKKLDAEIKDKKDTTTAQIAKMIKAAQAKAAKTVEKANEIKKEYEQIATAKTKEEQAIPVTLLESSSSPKNSVSQVLETYHRHAEESVKKAKETAAEASKDPSSALASVVAKAAVEDAMVALREFRQVRNAVAGRPTDGSREKEFFINPVGRHS